MRRLLTPLLCIFATKIIFFHGTMSETVALLGVVGFTALLEHNASVRKIDDYKKLLEEYRSELSGIRSELDVTKTSMASVKLAQGFKSVNGK